MSFRDAILEELSGYPWLAGATATAMFGVFGDAQDASKSDLADAIRMRDPAKCPPDALDPIGRDRRVLRAPIETADNYRARLATAPTDWYWGGTDTGFLTFVFAPYGFDDTTVQSFSNDEIAWDDNTDWHSRGFFLADSTDGYFTTDGLWPEDDGDEDPGDNWIEDDDGSTWDSNATAADIAYLRSSIRLTKGDYAYPVTIGVWLSGDGALPDGFWDSPGGDWPEADGDADGAVWDEGDGGEEPYYLTLGNVWGQEAWLGDGPNTDVWSEDDEPMVDLPEQERWIAFPGEED